MARIGVQERDMHFDVGYRFSLDVVRQTQAHDFGVKVESLLPIFNAEDDVAEPAIARDETARDES